MVLGAERALANDPAGFQQASDAWQGQANFTAQVARLLQLTDQPAAAQALLTGATAP